MTERDGAWQAIFDAVSNHCAHTGPCVEPIGCLDCAQITDEVAVVAPLIRSREAERIANEIEDQITGQIEHTHYDSAYAHSALIARVPRVAR